MKKSIFLIALVLVAITAYAGQWYAYTQTGAKTYAPIDADDVTLVIDGSKPPADAKEVGIISYKTGAEPHLWKHARRLAAKHGCNYVFVEKKYKDNFYIANKGTLHLYRLNEAHAKEIIPAPPTPEFEKGDKVIYMGAREHPATIINKEDADRYKVRIDDEADVVKIIPAVKLKKAE